MAYGWAQLKLLLLTEMTEIHERLKQDSELVKTI